MQFVMYSGKLHIYQHSFFITYDICVCKHVFPITILQNIMCKCAKSFSFWGTSSPDTLPGLCPWTSLGDFRPRTSLLAIVYCRPLWGNPPPKKNRNTPQTIRRNRRTRGTNSCLTFSDQITGLYKSCCYHIRELRCIRPYLDFKTAAPLSAPPFILNLTSVTLSIITFQTATLTGSNRFNSLACDVVKALKSTHITPILIFLHWPKVTANASNINFPLTYKVLTTAQTSYLQFSQPYLSSTSSQYPLLICCHSFSPANHLLFENHGSLI